MVSSSDLLADYADRRLRTKKPPAPVSRADPPSRKPRFRLVGAVDPSPVLTPPTGAAAVTPATTGAWAAGTVAVTPRTASGAGAATGTVATTGETTTGVTTGGVTTGGVTTGGVTTGGVTGRLWCLGGHTL